MGRVFAILEHVDAHPKRPDWERLARRTLASEARYAAIRAFVTEASPDDVDRLLTLAVTLDPDGETMLEKWSWKIRRRLGPTWSRRFRPFLPRGALVAGDGTEPKIAAFVAECEFQWVGAWPET